MDAKKELSLDDFTELMSVLFDGYGESDGKQIGRVKVFYGMLKDFPVNEIVMAFQAHLANEDRFPSVSQILKRIPSYMTDDQIASESWIRILRQCEPWSPVFYNPETGGIPTLERITQEERDVLEQIGGVEHLYDILDSQRDVEFMRKTYVAAFVSSPGYSQIRGFIEKEVKQYALEIAEKLKKLNAPKPLYPCEKCQSMNVKRNENVSYAAVYNCQDCGCEYVVDPRDMAIYDEKRVAVIE